MHKFYFIKTNHTIDWLEQLLYIQGYGSSQNILKVIRDNRGRETDRTIGFLDENVYTVLIQQNRPDLKIEPFIVPKNFYPDELTYTYNFCIPFPEEAIISSKQSIPINTTTQRDQFYINQIELKLAPFKTQQIISTDSYKIHIPVISREKNKTKNIAFLIFHPSVSKETLSIIRYILDGSSWNDRVTPFRCYWARLSSKQANRLNLNKK